MCVAAVVPVLAQQSGAQPTNLITANSSLTDRLDIISDIIESKRLQRTELEQTIAEAPDNGAVEERERLLQLSADIARLRTTFELLALGDIDIDLSEEDGKAYDWREEAVEIVAPLLDSLKAVTRKPRQKTELRESIALNSEKLATADEAILALDELPLNELDADTQQRVAELLDKWRTDKQSYQQSLVVDTAQLERLVSTDATFASTFWPATKGFLLGRGLTLCLAVLAAIVVWLIMRFLWWSASKYLISKNQRRRSTWYRLLSYSYYLFNFVVALVVVMAVLYVREDLFLLALAVVAIAGAALGLRRFVPGYLREAKLLINLGSVREGERVSYRGLPWQVMSLNLETVLRNPALDGIVRLPLDSISVLTSRPFRDELWFPCERDDYIFLPDGRFGQVLQQTPELVQVRVRGGMVQSWPTADFYAATITNISRGESYGVAVTFGYDYALQAISLASVPQTLHAAIAKAFEENELGDALLDLMVELKSAGASSIDYIIYATIDSEFAANYYQVDRIIQQTCVSVANVQGWGIPFPQLTVHRPTYDLGVETG